MPESDPHHIDLRNAISGAINDWVSIGDEENQAMVILGALADITAELIGQAPQRLRGRLVTMFVTALGERLSLDVTAIHREPKAHLDG